MKFSKEHTNSCDFSTWKDRVKQETNSFFHSVNEGVKSKKILPQDLQILTQPKQNTIRTRSYVNIEDFYNKNILQSSISDFPIEKPSLHRYNNYPWTKSSVYLAHNHEVQDIKSSKYLYNQLKLQKQWKRQKNISENLFAGYSSCRKNIKKLPPLKPTKS